MPFHRDHSADKAVADLLLYRPEKKFRLVHVVVIYKRLTNAQVTFAPESHEFHEHFGEKSFRCVLKVTRVFNGCRTVY